MVLITRITNPNIKLCNLLTKLIFFKNIILFQISTFDMKPFDTLVTCKSQSIKSNMVITTTTFQEPWRLSIWAWYWYGYTVITSDSSSHQVDGFFRQMFFIAKVPEVQVLVPGRCLVDPVVVAHQDLFIKINVTFSDY